MSPRKFWSSSRLPFEQNERSPGCDGGIVERQLTCYSRVISVTRGRVDFGLSLTPCTKIYNYTWKGSHAPPLSLRIVKQVWHLPGDMTNCRARRIELLDGQGAMTHVGDL